MSKASQRCDLCMFREGHNGRSLLTCPKCKVSVHKECYGLTDRSANSSWCRACKAVGMLLDGRTSKGENKIIKQEERPSDCVLCCHSTGIHAMHPLFDKHGKEGKHLILHNGTLAWVHSLCAQVIAQCRNTGGCVYGCDIQGDYGGEPVEAESDNPSDPVDSDIEVTLHHFVMVDESERDYWNILKEHRKSLKCRVCGRKSDAKSLRVAIQCSAGDKGEYPEFSLTHTEDQPCYEAMHIGCAMWAREKGPYRRIYFDPGSVNEPVVEVYCPRHAADIKRGQPQTPSSHLTRDPGNAKIGYETNVASTGHESDENVFDRSSSVRRSSRNSRTVTMRRNSDAKVTGRATSVLSQEAQPQSSVCDSSSQRERPTIDLTAPVRRDSSLSAVPKQQTSPVIRKTVFQESSGNSVAPDLSRTIYKRRPSARPLGSYETAVEATAKFAQASVSMPKAKHTVMQADLLLVPPPYQRVSSNVTRNKAGQTRATNTASKPDIYVDNDIVSKLDQHSSKESVKLSNLARRVRKRYISESKQAEQDRGDDNYGAWLADMIFDAQRALSIAKNEGIDPRVALEARQFYWKQKSGIFGSDFRELWGSVRKTLSVDSFDTVSHFTDEFQSDSDDEIPGDNKWASLWKEGAKLYEFGEWDETSVQLKPKLH